MSSLATTIVAALLGGVIADEYEDALQAALALPDDAAIHVALESIEQRWPDRTSTQIQLAYRLRVYHQFERTEAFCDRILARDPDHLDALDYAAQCATARQDFALAARRYDDAMRVHARREPERGAGTSWDEWNQRAKSLRSGREFVANEVSRQAGLTARLADAHMISIGAVIATLLAVAILRWRAAANA